MKKPAKQWVFGFVLTTFGGAVLIVTLGVVPALAVLAVVAGYGIQVDATERMKELQRKENYKKKRENNV